ncbi:uncharacterized protein LOC118666062 isoform X1 [Myotis myotis]|uniref:uncharacterized protein LOC118666062 isoform X1 n=1 Tax=Myotis myotis TaxID=51298 RepID=UPI00174BA739|nr:uncharacterized protein LOC118666062 isoform X1 [Myotis myotis]
MLSPAATGVWFLIGHAFSCPASVVKAASDWRAVGRYAESGQVAWARFGGRGAGQHQGPSASGRSPPERPGLPSLAEVLCRLQFRRCRSADYLLVIRRKTRTVGKCGLSHLSLDESYCHETWAVTLLCLQHHL